MRRFLGIVFGAVIALSPLGFMQAQTQDPLSQTEASRLADLIDIDGLIAVMRDEVDARDEQRMRRAGPPCVRAEGGNRDARRPKRGGGISGKKWIARSGGKNHDAIFLQMPNSAAADERFSKLRNINRRHRPRINIEFFQRVL